MQNFVVICIYLFWSKFLCVSSTFYFNGRKQYVNDENFPWVGVLKVNQYELTRGGRDAVTGIVMLTQKAALGVADDLAKISKDNVSETVSATFYTRDHFPVNFKVTNFTVHPEYLKATSNTLAVVILEPINDNNFNLSIPLSLPKTHHTVNYWDLLYFIAFTDRDKKLNQGIFEMQMVTDDLCHNFYFKEKLNHKMVWPKHSLCYKSPSMQTSCVFNPGMALVSNITGNWILVGISTLGPGCSLPARFIEIFPYVGWIGSTLYVPPKPAAALRSIYDSDSFNWSPGYLPRDRLFMNFLMYGNYTKYVMRPVPLHYTDVFFNEECNNRDGEIMYAEGGRIEGNPFRFATALYELSYYDYRYKRPTCMLVTMNCSEMGEVQVYHKQGFETTEFDSLVSHIPIKKKDGTYRPRILTVQDNYDRYEHFDTLLIRFKFVYFGQADIRILFYGLRKKQEPTPFLPPHILRAGKGRTSTHAHTHTPYPTRTITHTPKHHDYGVEMEIYEETTPFTEETTEIPIW